jgi:hypothetical protein
MGTEHIFNVECELVQAHADTVDTLTDDLAAVRSAANVAMDPDAYGWLCGFLPPLVGDVSGRGAETLAAATQALTETSRTVRGAGASFQHCDAAAASARVNPHTPTLNGPVND